jgi:hypothetical protein
VGGLDPKRAPQPQPASAGTVCPRLARSSEGARSRRPRLTAFGSSDKFKSFEFVGEKGLGKAFIILFIILTTSPPPADPGAPLSPLPSRLSASQVAAHTRRTVPLAELGSPDVAATDFFP